MKVEKLLDVVQIKNPKPEKFSGEKRYYSTGNINEYDVSENFGLVKFENRPSRANVQPIENSVGFAKMKSTAKTVLVTKNHSECIFSTGMNFLVPSENIISKYLYYYLISPYFLDLKDKYSGQGIMGGLSNKDLNLFKIPVPSLQEQEKIVERMDEVFETTNTISSINEKKNDLFDLLNKSFYEGLFENMKIFPSVELIEVCKLITDGSHFSPKEFSNEYPYITVKDIDSYGNIDFVNCKKIDKELFLKMKSNNCNPLFGDILFSKDGTIGKTSLIDTKDEFVVLSSLAIIRPDQTKINKNFLFNLVSSPKFIELCVAKKTGVAIQRIILKNLKTVNLPVPPLEIQEELSKKINKFKEYLKTLENNLNSTEVKKEEFKKSILKMEFSYE